MNIAVVGAGIIGRERIKALEKLGENIIVVDPAVKIPKYPQYYDFKSAVINEDIDWIFVCTPHNITKEIVIEALSHGFNVLAEKPLGRDLDEFSEIIRNHADEKLNVGFNYRFYKGVRQLLQDCKDHLFGDLISVNMILGLGDAPGSEKTWRLDPKRAGRGAILDPGIHLIDLAMLISDDRLYNAQLKTWEGFWKTKIEEESHLVARDSHIGTIYNIQFSVCRWRNTFRIEVNGTDGYGIVEGRNRNYGNQIYRRGKRWGWACGLPQRETEELVIDYEGEDSFYEETKAVLYGCQGIQPGTAEDNRRCLEFIESL
jgi:predicted dehydrogenase